MNIGAIYMPASYRLPLYPHLAHIDPFLDALSFLRNGYDEHETTAKLKPENRSLQQYIMLVGVRVLDGCVYTVSLKMDTKWTPGLPGL